MASRVFSRVRLLLLAATAAALLTTTPIAHGQPPSLPLPTAAFDLDVTSGAVPLLVTFTDRSQNADSWSWDFGDGVTSDAQNPSHLYTHPGLFEVTLTACAPAGEAGHETAAGDIGGCDTTSATVDVTGRDALDGGLLRGSGTVYGAVNWEGDEDRWTFDARRGDHVTIALDATPPNTLDPVLRLFAPDGEVIAFNDADFTSVDSTSVDFTSFDFTLDSFIPELALPAAGLYTIQTTGFFDSTGPYALTLTLTDVTAPRAAFDADPTSGVAPLTVQFTNRSRNVTTFAWDFGDGAPAAEGGHESAAEGGHESAAEGGHESAADRHPQHTYDAPGSYTVTLTACRGVLCADTSLTIDVETHDGGPLLSGTTRISTIDFLDDSDLWTFTLPPGVEVTIDVFALDRELDPFLTLFDAQGEPINADDDSGGGLNPRLADLSLPAGSYLAELFDLSGQATGDYTITLTVNTEPIVRAEAFIPSTGPFFAPATIDFFDASLGQPTSWTWAFGDGTAATGRNVTHQFTTPGLYPVRLTACNARSCDTWHIRVAVEADADGGAIGLDEAVFGAIDPGDDSDAWTFTGAAGQVVDIAVFVDFASFFDPTLELLGPDGVVLTSDDDSGGDRQPLIAGFTLPADGEYTITVRGFDEFESGRYELHLSLHDSAIPTP